MRTLLIALTLLSNTVVPANSFIGVAQNEHYIINSNNEGYYIEEELGIYTDDTVAIVNGEVYIIDCDH